MAIAQENTITIHQHLHMPDAAYGAGSWLTKSRKQVLPKTVYLMNLSSANEFEFQRLHTQW